MNWVILTGTEKVDFNTQSPYIIFLVGENLATAAHAIRYALSPEDARAMIEKEISNTPELSSYSVIYIQAINLLDAVQLGRWAKNRTQGL